MWETVDISVHQSLNMSDITFVVPRVGRPTFVFKKCSDKIYVHD